MLLGVVGHQEEVHDYVVKLRKAERSAAEPMTRAPAGSLHDENVVPRAAPQRE